MTDAVPLPDPPRVSCIMPTANRRRFVARAVELFLAQDYPNRELVVLDDGDESVADLVASVDGVRYVRTAPGASLGEKRNQACAEATGDLIAHWDDDDWYAPNRLSIQVRTLISEGTGLCGLQRILFADPSSGRAWEYRYGGKTPWLSGSTLVYRRDVWSKFAFPKVDQGEDGLFVHRAASAGISVVTDPGLHVGRVHPGNTSPKRTDDVWWKPLGRRRAETLVTLLDTAPPAPSTRPESPAAAHPSVEPPFRHLYACLVHERGECVVDLCRNLLHLDPRSVVLVYDGGTDPSVIASVRRALGDRVQIHPDPRPMKWGTLHDFAFDCFRWARTHGGFDAVTIVDSDQLALRPNWSGALASWLADRPRVGLLSNEPNRQTRGSTVPPVSTAWQEFERWRPFLKKFPDGESKWVYWCFWPGTVLTGPAAEALLNLYDSDPDLRALLGTGSRLWATEEVLFPTLAALLGFEIDAHPGSRRWVQYAQRWTPRDVQAATNACAWWMHPVPRVYGDPIRHAVREANGHYFRPPTVKPEGIFRTAPLVARVARIDGWLAPEEAELLVLGVRDCVPRVEGAVVEVGSYLGKATVLLALALQSTGTARRLLAIDPHDGRIGAADEGYSRGHSSPARLKANLEDADVAAFVETHSCAAHELDWSDPIAFLLVDGLHDYPSVATDVRHLAPWVAEGGFLALHDHADYFPGVQAIAAELLASGEWTLADQAATLVLLRRVRSRRSNPSAQIPRRMPSKRRQSASGDA